MTLLRSLLFLIFLASFTIFQFFFIVISLPFLSYENRTKFIVLWSKVYITAIRIICGVKFEIKGKENIPVDKNILIISNHQSDFETVLLLMMFQPQATVIKQELLKIPFYGWAFKLINPIAIDRSKKTASLKQILTEGSQRLRDGSWVVIFPEGTRQEPEDRTSFNAGGAMLGVKSGFPILPIAHNSGTYCPRKSIIKKSGTISFVIGKPVETSGRRVKGVNNEVENWIHNQLDILDNV